MTRQGRIQYLLLQSLTDAFVLELGAHPAILLQQVRDALILADELLGQQLYVLLAVRQLGAPHLNNGLLVFVHLRLRKTNIEQAQHIVLHYRYGEKQTDEAFYYGMDIPAWFPWRRAAPA